MINYFEPSELGLFSIKVTFCSSTVSLQPLKWEHSVKEIKDIIAV